MIEFLWSASKKKEQAGGRPRTTAAAEWRPRDPTHYPGHHNRGGSTERCFAQMDGEGAFSGCGMVMNRARASALGTTAAQLVPET